ATRYFIKTECFCFNNQTLMAGEQKEMPLIFRVDTDLPQSVKTITLSYAFFRAQKESESTTATNAIIVGNNG
ncbi:MAG: cytochrome c oxidase assembly protein subunit 11, partial [Parasphingorhabdus sp.]